MTAEFDFIQSYRDLDEGASRNVVEARQKSFEKLSSSIDNMGQIYDLCRLAYQVEPFPNAHGSRTPFGNLIRISSPARIRSTLGGSPLCFFGSGWRHRDPMRRWRSLRRRTAVEGIPPTEMF